jgi:hypothetical protein
MKYFLLLTTNSQWFAGDSIFSEGLMKRMLRELPVAEASNQEFQEVSLDYVKENMYRLVSSCDFNGNSGEKNVFHDHNGNEYHN